MLACNGARLSSWKKRLRQGLSGSVLWLCTMLLAFALLFLVFLQQAFSGDRENFCSETARAALNACRNLARDGYWIAMGNCTNVSGPGARRQCIKDAETALDESVELCGHQRLARGNLCAYLGEARYDPDWTPENFVDPLEIGDEVAANPFLPLEQGRHWVYRSGEGRQTVTVTVTAATKRIGGVTCLVVNDLVVEDGEVVENTDDWYAQDLDGNVWYCGEIAVAFETGDGDQPQLPELVGLQGSWKAFRDRARPGVAMLAAPRVGAVYRQEMALGTAEDAAEVLGLEGSARVPAAGASCSGTCLVTRDFTPLEPDAAEHKYYAPGVGLVLVLDPESGERAELVDFATPERQARPEPCGPCKGSAEVPI